MNCENTSTRRPHRPGRAAGRPAVRAWRAPSGVGGLRGSFDQSGVAADLAQFQQGIEDGDLRAFKPCRSSVSTHRFVGGGAYGLVIAHAGCLCNCTQGGFCAWWWKLVLRPFMARCKWRHRVATAVGAGFAAVFSDIASGRWKRRTPRKPGIKKSKLRPPACPYFSSGVPVRHQWWWPEAVQGGRQAAVLHHLGLSRSRRKKEGQLPHHARAAGGGEHQVVVCNG